MKLPNVEKCDMIQNNTTFYEDERAMDKGNVYIYTGDGRGKTPAAWGRALQAATEGKSVMVIQFLKGRGMLDSGILQRLEPEIRLYHFEKSDENYMELSEEKKKEEIVNIRNGFNFARKVLAVGECDLLILDEVLGLVENHIIEAEELRKLLELRKDTDVIMTGAYLSDEICFMAAEVSKIETVKFKIWD